MPHNTALFWYFILANLLCSLSLNSQVELNPYTSDIPAKILPYHKSLEKALLNGAIDSAQLIYDNMIESIDTSAYDSHTKAWIWYHSGDVLSYGQKYNQSNKAYLRAIRKTLEMSKPNIVILIRAHNNLYYNHDEIGNYDEAFENILKAYEYLEYAPADEKISNILYNLARSLKSQGELSLAGKYMERVIELDKKDNDSLAMGYNHQFLGEIYRLKKDGPNAINEYRKAIKINPQHQNERRSMYESGIANAYLLLNELDSALIHAENAIEYGRASEMKNIVAFALTQKGQICTQQKNTLCANIAFNESILIAEALGIKNLKTKNELYKAELAPGLERKQILEGVIEQCIENDWREIHRTALNILLKDKSLLNASERIKYLTDYNSLLKDFISEEADKESKRLDARMKLITHEQQITTLKQQAEISAQQAKNNTIIRWVLISLIFILLASALLVYYTYKQRQQLSKAQYLNQISAKVNEVETLRNRLTSILDQQNESIPLPPLSELNAIIDSPLTDKEYEVLVDVAKGLTNKEIAQIQFISANTVKFHLKNIFFKLEVNNRKEAIKEIISKVS